MIKATRTITIRLPKDLNASLKKISVTDRIPVSDLVRESIKRLIAVRQFEHLRKQVLPFAEANGYLTDEDVFKKVS